MSSNAIRWCLVFFVSLLAPLLVRADAPAPDTSLTEGSVWRGSWSMDWRRAHAATTMAAVRITRREDQKLAGVLRVGEGKKVHAMRFEGLVAEDGSLKLKPVAIQSGVWDNHALDQIYLGKVDGDHLAFRMLNSPDPNTQGAGVDVTLFSKKDNGKDD